VCGLDDGRCVDVSTMNVARGDETALPPVVDTGLRNPSPAR